MFNNNEEKIEYPAIKIGGRPNKPEIKKKHYGSFFSKLNLESFLTILVLIATLVLIGSFFIKRVMGPSLEIKAPAGYEVIYNQGPPFIQPKQ
ncbi:MAG: hypothetical protein JW740_00495 [Candidatus Zambryskibacteria bacterium]|nr:hypothetical protein [Candidatus Zambryskibacteria bacterium]